MSNNPYPNQESADKFRVDLLRAIDSLDRFTSLATLSSFGPSRQRTLRNSLMDLHCALSAFTPNSTPNT